MEIDYSSLTGKEMRKLIREGKYKKCTAFCAIEFLQADVYIIPEKLAADFRGLCEKNPKIISIIFEGKPGEYLLPDNIAENADIRTDLKFYHVIKNGKIEAELLDDIKDHWREDLVIFLTGCSFTFENELMKNNIELRHITEKVNLPIYKTNIKLEPYGNLMGNLYVSMRPIHEDLLENVIKITSKYADCHGEPMFICDNIEDCLKYGIDIKNPIYGKGVTIKEKEKLVFWACGISGHKLLIDPKIDYAIIQSDVSCMFVTDLKAEK